ncbi:MAG: hypothetical protein KC621_35150 [Myxococcales bacterium]|nr:hypothetical protein [Myxococcales bacterium]
MREHAPAPVGAAPDRAEPPPPSEAPDTPEEHALTAVAKASGPGPVVDQSTDRDDIVVTWRRDQVGMLDALRGKQAEAEAAIEDQRMLYDAALDEVDSEEGRALVMTWKEARLSSREERAKSAAKAVEMWEKLEAMKAR